MLMSALSACGVSPPSLYEARQAALQEMRQSVHEARLSALNVSGKSSMKKPSQSSSQNTNQSDSSSDNTRAAVVDDLSGVVTAISGGEDMTAFKGLALLRKDSIGTGEESWTCLELNEGQFVLIEENSSVQISQLSDDAKNVELSLSSGKIWVNLTDKLSAGESFEVKTPTCALSIRGTMFSVSCDEEGGGRIVVYNGIVNVQAGKENIDLFASAA